MPTLAHRQNISRASPRPGERSIRVMLVDDSLVVRSVLERIIDGQQGMHICAAAASANEALDWLADDRADVIVLDIEMPGMNGLAALPHILDQAAHARVLVLSSNCVEGGPAAIEALALGASDTLAKPGRGSFSGQFTEVLVQRIRSLAARPQASPPRSSPPPGPIAAGLPDVGTAPLACIAVAASTGGIPAFSSFLANLDRNIAAPILLTQHLPDAFIPYYAQQIAMASKRDVHVAATGQRLQPRHVYLAPGDGHIMLARVGRHVEILIDGRAVANGCCPSADPMFAATADIFGAAAAAVVLSGMGRDGAEGAARLRAAGGRVLAQAPESCVVWGMPGAVVNAGTANAVLNPDAMAVLLGRAAALTVTP